MPRAPGIYRTVKLSKVDCLCLDIKKETTYKETLYTPYIADVKQLEKKLKLSYDDKKHRIANISKVTTEDVRYFIPLNTFLKVAESEREDLKLWLL